MSAYSRLRAMLGQGALVAGQIVQERRLAEELGFSRTPVRDALGRLEGERLLQRNGRLLLVATITVPEIMDILRIRWLLEGEAAQLAATQMDRAEIAALRAEILGMKNEQLLTEDAHWALDDRLHLGIARASGNAELSRLVTDLRQRTRMFGLHRIPARFDAGRQEHLAILDALATRAPAEAAHLMRVHLDHARDAIIATLRRTPAP